MEYRRPSDTRTTDRSGATAAPRRASAVPGPARSPEPRDAGGPRPVGRTVGRPGGSGVPHRLTAAGGAVVTLGATLLGGAVDYWLFGGTGIVMGLAYLLACFQVAVRVRAADLAVAPICGPIAFALTLGLLGTGPGGGVLGRIVGLATALALQAGWLFTGTGVSLLIVLARHVALRRARRRTGQQG